MSKGIRIIREPWYPPEAVEEGPDSPRFRTRESLPHFGNQLSRPDINQNSDPTRGRVYNQIPLQESQAYQQRSNTRDQVLKVVVNIKLGEGSEEQIKCKTDDDPEWLARGFCRAYGVSEQAVPIIVREIKKQFRIAVKKQEDQAHRPPASQFTFSPQRENYDEIRNSLTSGARESIENDYRQSEAPSVRISKSKPIAKMNIDLGPDQQGIISIYKGEDPAEVAWKFCQENNLPKPAYDQLFKNLRSLVDKYEAKQRKKTDKKSSAPSEQRSETETSPPQSMQRKRSDSPSSPDHSQKNSVPSQKSIRSQKGNAPSQNKGMAQPIQQSVTPVELAIPSTPITKPKNDKEPPEHLMKSWEKWQKVITTKVKRGKDGRLSGNHSDHEDGDKKDFLQIAQNIVANAKAQSPDEKHEEPKRVSKGEIQKISQRMYESARHREERLASLREIENEQRKIQKEKEEALTSEKDESFRPQRSKSTGPLLLRYMNIQEEITKRHKLEQERIQNLILECPFRPTLDKKTLELTKGSRTHSKSPIHHRLYYEGLAHEKHMEEWREMAMNELYKFHPTLNDDIENFLTKRPKLSTMKFIESLYQWKRDKETRRLAKYMEENNGIDHKTGQPLHHPKFNHDSYYWKVKDRDDWKYDLVLDVGALKVKKNPERCRLYQGTYPVVELMRLTFDLMDSDKDQKISPNKIDISNLERPILEALLEFFDWLEKENREVDFEGFHQALLDLNIEPNVVEAFEIIRRERLGALYPENTSKQETASHAKLTPRTPKTPKGSSYGSSIKSSRETPVIPKHYRQMLERKLDKAQTTEQSI